MLRSINIAVRSGTSRYVALDLTDKAKVIAEGRTALAVARKARKTGRSFSMMFLPERGKTYVY